MIEINDLSRDWKEFSVHIDLRIQENEYFVILGPTASGKTLLLELVAGFYHPDSGTIVIGDRDITDLPPEKRDVGFVYQDYSLFPHLNVRENIEFGMRMKKVPNDERSRKTQEIMDLMGISHLAHRYSITLSGGEQQRAALARAIVAKPGILLLDEPLSALDNRTQNLLRDELKRIHHEFGLTTIHVTHDQSEAMMLADRIGVMVAGRIVQVGPPEEVFSRPATNEVADFVGVENIIDGTVISNTDGLAEIDLGGHTIVAVSDYAAGELVRTCIRPEDIVIGTPETAGGSSARNSFSGTITQVTPFGAMVRLRIDCNCNFPLTALVTKQSANDLGLDTGAEIVVSFKSTAIHLIKE